MLFDTHFDTAASGSPGVADRDKSSGDEADKLSSKAAPAPPPSPPPAATGGGGGAQNKGKRKQSRGVAEAGPVQVVDGYEKVLLEDGGFKKRRVGAKQWQRHCTHGRHRSKCKECGGTSICEHGRVRNTCKECGGASICEHGRQRNRCKECGGASVCEHGRERSKCKQIGRASCRERV